MKTELRENADAVRPLSSAVRAMAQWFQKELGEILRAIDYGERHLASNPDDHVTRASVEQLKADRDVLLDGWETSSLRKAAGSTVDEPAGSGRERRGGLAVADAPSAVPSDRATDTGARTVAKSIQGYAATFGRETIIGGVFREVIEAGAFSEALANSDIRCLFNHDANYLLGRTSAATLECKEDSRGLFFRAYLLVYDAVSYAVARRVDRGDLSGCSFSFSDTTDRWQLARKPGELDLRIIEKIGRLYDLGPVSFPAYESTTISASFEKLPVRSESPADAGGGTPAKPGGRSIPAWKQRLMEIEQKSLQDELRESELEPGYCERRLADQRRRFALHQRRMAHVALHPGDGGRIDVPGGLC